jgi:hypothetical protein
LIYVCGLSGRLRCRTDVTHWLLFLHDNHIDFVEHIKETQMKADYCEQQKKDLSTNKVHLNHVGYWFSNFLNNNSNNNNIVNNNNNDNSGINNYYFQKKKLMFLFYLVLLFFLFCYNNISYVNGTLYNFFFFF